MHKIRCTHQYCAIDDSICKKYTNLSVYMDWARKEEKKLFKQLNTQSIKKCSRNEYTWQSGDICLNSFTCHTKRTIVMHRKSNVVVSVNKTVYCLCSSRHDYLCDIKYCAINKEACDEFKLTRNETASINKCIQYTLNLTSFFVDLFYY